MKKFILMAIISLVCLAVKAAEPVDTIAFTAPIEKVVVDVTKNTKGKEVTKYYFMSNGYLIPTTKTVMDKYNLCKKHNAKCALNAVVSKKTKSIKKIILG